jgi:hypothetical protein
MEIGQNKFLERKMDKVNKAYSEFKRKHQKIFIAIIFLCLLIQGWEGIYSWSRTITTPKLKSKEKLTINCNREIETYEKYMRVKGEMLSIRMAVNDLPFLTNECTLLLFNNQYSQICILRIRQIKYKHIILYNEKKSTLFCCLHLNNF